MFQTSYQKSGQSNLTPVRLRKFQTSIPSCIHIEPDPHPTGFVSSSCITPTPQNMFHSLNLQTDESDDSDKELEDVSTTSKFMQLREQLRGAFVPKNMKRVQSTAEMDWSPIRYSNASALNWTPPTGTSYKRRLPKFSNGSLSGLGSNTSNLGGMGLNPKVGGMAGIPSFGSSVNSTFSKPQGMFEHKPQEPSSWNLAPQKFFLKEVHQITVLTI